MNKQKIYVIRKIGFEYGDDYFYNIGMAEYFDSFTDLGEARSILEKAENKIYREYFLIQFLFGDNKNSDTRRARAKAYDEYIQNHFNVSIKEGKGDWDYDESFKLPADATDEQIKEIRDIIGIQFHTIIEAEKENEDEIKYVISNLDTDSHVNQREYADPLFYEIFDNEYEAYSAILERYSFEKDEDSVIGFEGSSLESLSDLPNLFEEYMKSCSCWELEKSLYYEEYFDYKIIRLNSCEDKYVITELKGLLPLLKNPPFKVIQI